MFRAHVLETPYCNTYMGLNFCCASMTDDEIRSKIRRQQADTPLMQIHRPDNLPVAVATPPPGPRMFPIIIPFMQGYFHISENGAVEIQNNLDLD